MQASALATPREDENQAASPEHDAPSTNVRRMAENRRSSEWC